MINKAYKVTKVKAMQNEIYVKEGFQGYGILRLLAVGQPMIVEGDNGVCTSWVLSITKDDTGTIIVETQNSIYTLVEEKNEKN